MFVGVYMRFGCAVHTVVKLVCRNYFSNLTLTLPRLTSLGGGHRAVSMSNLGLLSFYLDLVQCCVSLLPISLHRWEVHVALYRYRLRGFIYSVLPSQSVLP